MLVPGGVNVGRSDAGKTITSLFQRELHLWRGAYQQPKSEFSQSGGAVDQYNMQLSCGEKRYTIPVLHVKNWPDHQPLPSTNQLEYLADIVKNSNQNGAPGRSSSDKHLPMIHCLGGVGRTGTMAAALVLKDNPHSNLEQVRADFRDSRNNRMLEDASQFVQLKAMQAQLLMTTAS